MQLEKNLSIMSRFMEISSCVRQTEAVTFMMPEYIHPSGMRLPTTMYQCMPKDVPSPEAEEDYILWLTEKDNNKFKRKLSFNDAFIIDYIMLRLALLKKTLFGAAEFIHKGPLSPMAVHYFLADHISEYPSRGVWDDPYISEVKLPKNTTPGKYSFGDFVLMPLCAFQCGPYVQDASNPGLAMPDIGYSRNELVTPGIFCSEYDGVYSDVTPRFMSLMKPYIENAFGRVLCFDPCLGYFAYMVARKDNVENVTVVCSDSDKASFLIDNVLPGMDKDIRDKISIFDGEQRECLEKLDDGLYDYIFSDLWNNICESNEYLENRYIFDRFVMTKVDVWLEETFLAHLLTTVNYIFQSRLRNVPFREIGDEVMISKMEFLEEGFEDRVVSTPQELDDIYRFDSIKRCIKGRKYIKPEFNPEFKLE